MAGRRPTRILILGGGFGGWYAAMALQKRLAPDPGVEITLVNQDNYFGFRPMLPEVISGSIGIFDSIIRLRRLCPRVTLYAREVEEVDLHRRLVITSRGVSHRAAALEYDHHQRGGRGRRRTPRGARGRSRQAGSRAVVWRAGPHQPDAAERHGAEPDPPRCADAGSGRVQRFVQPYPAASSVVSAPGSGAQPGVHLAALLREGTYGRLQ
ncbi:MAG: FAD-dependent oxidoreductase [Candidatus Rokubacteria bacterium]|nr:FAD-dependent oxidoreductase [Candidatus Rokubacteria bacterium]